MAENTKKMLKVQFKTRVGEKGKIEAADKVYTLPDDKAKAYIERGLAVEVKVTGKDAKADA